MSVYIHDTSVRKLKEMYPAEMLLIFGFCGCMPKSGEE